MPSKQSFDGILDILYAAPGDIAGWRRFLDEFASLLNAAVVTYVTFDAGHDAYTVNGMSEFDPAFPKAYQEHYAAMDEWYLRAQQKITSGYVDDGRALCPNRELIRTGFYNEFLRPHNLLHECAAVLDLSASSVHALTLLRRSSQEEFSNDDLRLLRGFVPHIKRAANLHRRFVDLHSRSVSHQWVLDTVEFGVVILRADGTVLLANRLAQQLCKAGGLRLTSRGLGALGAADSELHALISSARNPALGAPHGPVVIGRSNNAPLVITAGPIRQTQDTGTGPLIAVFIQDPGRRQKAPSEVIARLYGLTPAEARLAILLAHGTSLPEAAEACGVTRNTVKTQAKSIYAKVGAKTQSQLVEVLCRIHGNLHPTG